MPKNEKTAKPYMSVVGYTTEIQNGNRGKEVVQPDLSERIVRVHREEKK